MITIRPSASRGHARYSWLDSKHTFSFGEYYDPRHMGVSVLRVINDDVVAPSAGFETHPHRNMEIISYVISGEIEHKDTMGFHTVLRKGDVQVMSAGKGLFHSEFNHSDSEPLNFLQIWITPNVYDTKPGYAEKNFSETKGITPLVSPDGRNGSLLIKQDASIYKVDLNGESLNLELSVEKAYYLHIIKGKAAINGKDLKSGDGATVLAENKLNYSTKGKFESLLFELPN